MEKWEENVIYPQSFVVIDLNNINTICDVGSGAGFPSIPLKICYPHLKVTIVEPKIYSDGNTLYVKNATGRVVLYEVNGRVVYSKKAEENAVIEISNLKTGVYLLVVDGSPSKVVVR